jgi:excinuclease ABC subunit A
MSAEELPVREAPPAPPPAIHVRGVRVHNLKNIDIEIPLGRLVVLTGVSGSGKSSLAFDTLYAEGQRRYVESLSLYARQFLERMERPDVAEMDGICPAIALRQRSPSRNPRSTVATAAELHDFLRLLFARVGRTVCECGRTVTRRTPQSIAEAILAEHAGARALIAFTPPPVEGDALAELAKKGFTRLLAGETAVEIEAVLAKQAALPAGPLLALVDRVVLKADGRSRLVESIEAALAAGGGSLHVQIVGGPAAVHTDRFECAPCGRVFDEPQPRLFSFNSPFGACPSCHGFGNLIEVDQNLVVPDPGKSLGDGAIEPWRRTHYKAVVAELKRFARRRGIPMDVPWAELREDHRRLVLLGDDEFQGVVGFFRWLETKKYKVQVRVFLSRYRGYQTCPECHGSRLRREALRVKLGGLDIDRLCALSLRAAREFLRQLPLTETERATAGGVLADLDRRLGFLVDIGLDYLTLDRPYGTLSGGEAQRIALATSLGTGLVGTLYVLDEPSIGLHPRDTRRLIETLKGLRDQGNTVVVVEHDREMMATADHIIDLGPGAGEQGGRVVFQGSYAQLLEDGRSLTGKFLRGDIRIANHGPRRKGNGLSLWVRGARAHNLKGIDARIPLGTMTCITGVSGSGKSTLVHDVLCAGLLKSKGRWDRAVGAHDAIEGAEFIEEVVLVDQSPIGRSPRSNPITYVKAFDPIRELFAETKEARDRGLSASHFSFNVDGGRCRVCGGDGQVRVDMQFLADVFLLCEACGGRRYEPAVLDVRYRGKTIDQVLEMTVHEAAHFFGSQPRVVQKLKLFDKIGLGYLRLGQAANTLSGGEAQRLKLAAHLLRQPDRRVLYVLDEPTTGLHMADIRELLGCFERLLEAGATLVVIEHNMDVVKQADWVVDLGPEAGDGGGFLVYQGTPEGLVDRGQGVTARFLKEALAAEKLHLSG